MRQRDACAVVNGGDEQWRATALGVGPWCPVGLMGEIWSLIFGQVMTKSRHDKDVVRMSYGSVLAIFGVVVARSVFPSWSQSPKTLSIYLVWYQTTIGDNEAPKNNGDPYLTQIKFGWARKTSTSLPGLLSPPKCFNFFRVDNLFRVPPIDTPLSRWVDGISGQMNIPSDPPLCVGLGNADYYVIVCCFRVDMVSLR